jgi:CheY-like chemotaxis protein
MNRIKVLLVDDEEDWAAGWKEWFENTGQYEVEIEGFGIEAIDTALQFRPDIILLDWALNKDRGYGVPGDGMALAQRIRYHVGEHGHAEFDRVPILLITARLTKSEADTYSRDNEAAGIFGIAKTEGNLNTLARMSNILYRWAQRSA